MLAFSSLQFYLDSEADRGGGAEAERRQAAEAAFGPIAEKWARALEEADGFDLHEGLKRVKKKGGWGFADAAGTIVIEPQFEMERNFSEGLAPVKQRGLWGYINRSGHFVIEPQFADALAFDRGVGKVTPQGEQSGFYRFIDKTGRFVRNPDYRPND
jgi:hypothetical protein